MNPQVKHVLFQGYMAVLMLSEVAFAATFVVAVLQHPANLNSHAATPCNPTPPLPLSVWIVGAVARLVWAPLGIAYVHARWHKIVKEYRDLGVIMLIACVLGVGAQIYQNTHPTTCPAIHQQVYSDAPAGHGSMSAR